MNRSTREWLKLSGIVVLIVVTGIIIELIAVRYDIRFNLTGSLKYELTGRTKKILDSLRDNISIIHFGPRDKPKTRLIQNMLSLYGSYSHKVKWRVVDPDRNPMLVKRYEVSPEGNMTVVRYKNRWERIVISSENDLTNAILRLITKRIKVYFLLGGGEYDPFQPDNIYTKVLDLMMDENYDVKPLYWKNGSVSIPKDAKLVIVWRPKKEFTDREIMRFDSYIKNGGKMLFMVEPFTVDSLNKLLNKFHVVIKDDIVVDKSSRLIGGDMFMPMIMPFMFRGHVIVEHLGSPIMFPMARSVEITGGSPDGWEVKTILRTNPHSYTISKKRYDKWEFDYEPGDGERGPVSVAVSINGVDKSSKKGKMIIVGDADFANNSYIDFPGTDNRWFFANIIDWLIRGGDFVSDRPKIYKYNYRSLKDTERTRLLCVVIAMPVFVLMIGMGLYFKIKRVRI